MKKGIITLLLCLLSGSVYAKELFYNLQWLNEKGAVIKKAYVDDTVVLTAQSREEIDGRKVHIVVYKRDYYKKFVPVAHIDTQLKKNKIKVSWKFEYFQHTIKNRIIKGLVRKEYNKPLYVFKVFVDNREESKFSPKLKQFTWIEIVFTMEDGKPAPGFKYKMYLADGSVREGKTDKNGKCREDDLPPGNVSLDDEDYIFETKE